MGIYKNRRYSSGDLTLSLAAIAFPVHVWAIINILIVLPAWLLRLSLWELAGSIAYALADALLESLLLWLVFVVLAFILPVKWLAGRFAAVSIALAWLLCAWAILVQFIFVHLVQWGAQEIIPGLILVAATLGLTAWAVHHYNRLEGWIRQIARRLSILSYLYLAVDLAGLVVILLRNL